MTITPNDIAAVAGFVLAFVLAYFHWRGMLDEAHDLTANIEAQQAVLTSIRLARGWRSL